MGRSYSRASHDPLRDFPKDHFSVTGQTLKALFEAVYRKYPHTGEHARAVARLSGLVGREMSLPAHEMRTLLFGALLHDVGKIFVPDAILRKPGPLTPEERRIMQMHPIAGSRILERSEIPTGAVPAVRHHHERYDGNGYPYGLGGEDIPFAARVVQVADAFDAMTRDRCYRRGIPSAEASEEIERNAGIQFDPTIVRAFLVVTTDPQRSHSDCLVAAVLEQAPYLPDRDHADGRARHPRQRFADR